MDEKEKCSCTEEQQETVEQTEEVELSSEEKLQSELDKANKLADDYKDKWIRSVAEFDNYKKRNAKIWSDAYNEGKVDVMLKILPIGDNLDIAISMNIDEKSKEGIKLLKRKFEDVLKEMEMEEINPVGEKFDPNVAEAIMQAEASEGEQSDTVKQVFLKGYKIKDKIIRYAKVSVIK